MLEGERVWEQVLLVSGLRSHCWLLLGQWVAGDGGCPEDSTHLCPAVWRQPLWPPDVPWLIRPRPHCPDWREHFSCSWRGPSLPV